MMIDDFFYSSLETTDDCLTFAFITLYECFLWCLQSIYELFFQSFWQVLVYLLHNGRKREKRSKIQCDNQKNHSSVVLIPVRSSYCQTETCSRPLHEPLLLIHRESSLPNEKGEPCIAPAPPASLLSSKPFTYHRQQKKIQRQRRTNEKIPYVHSNQTLNKIDYFLSRYMNQLYSDTQHLR